MSKFQTEQNRRWNYWRI